MSEGYNGYRNRATWAVCLWLDNDEGLYLQWRRRARNLLGGTEDDEDDEDERREQLSKLADELKAYFEGLADDWVERPEELSRDCRLMLRDIGDLSDVDWREVAQSRLDE